ncbi:ran-specific GTPase-activating protein-like [Anthonomus grandis grandis]|uniref:ran-specific GTPase-activating protein-like n=1 Tax=Anthonomus grandis grandis TaxID=2921223 RepID=UPI0021660FAB|nr:ran-specific GTPase-activating protein-like [Anthonomus grandis grandis]
MSEFIDIPKTPEKGLNHDDSECNDEDPPASPKFTPVIELPEVEVPTHEEDEVEFLKIRAKLYRFDSSTDPPEWKERGTGELKMLKHKEKSSFRIVMRRDKTLKVCANHFITPMIELKPSLTNERAFVYTVLVDFADEKTRSECFAVKFANIENADMFRDKFEEAKKILLTDCELYNGTVDKQIENELKKILDENDQANEISEKLSELDVNTEEKDDAKKE